MTKGKGVIVHIETNKRCNGTGVANDTEQVKIAKTHLPRYETKERNNYRKYLLDDIGATQLMMPRASKLVTN